MAQHEKPLGGELLGGEGVSQLVGVAMTAVYGNMLAYGNLTGRWFTCGYSLTFCLREQLAGMLTPLAVIALCGPQAGDQLTVLYAYALWWAYLAQLVTALLRRFFGAPLSSWTLPVGWTTALGFSVAQSQRLDAAIGLVAGFLVAGASPSLAVTLWVQAGCYFAGHQMLLRLRDARRADQTFDALEQGKDIARKAEDRFQQR